MTVRSLIVSPPTAHCCRVKRSADFSTLTTTYTAIPFTAEDYDTDNMHDNSTNNTRITIPTIIDVITGLWHFEGFGYAGQNLGAVIRINGGSTYLGFGRESVWAGTVAQVNASGDYVCTAGDYVELLMNVSSGTSDLAFDAGVSPIFSATFQNKVT